MKNRVIRNMSELSYGKLNDKHILVYGDKKKYSSLMKQLDSRWSAKHEAWLMPAYNDDKMKQLVGILYPNQKSKKTSPLPNQSMKKTSPPPNQSVKKISRTRKPREELELKPEPVPQPIPLITEPKIPVESRFRRSRSPMVHSSDSEEEEEEKRIDPLQYYKSFKHSPNTFSSIHDNDPMDLSSSDSDEDSDDSSSSEDYPNPSPNRRKMINENEQLFNEMDKLRKKLYKLK